MEPKVTTSPEFGRAVYALHNPSPPSRYIAYLNTRQFYLCDTLTEAIDWRQQTGAWVYEPLAATVVDKIVKEDNSQELHRQFHMLWTKAVGTPDYDNAEWKELERLIFHPQTREVT